MHHPRILIYEQDGRIARRFRELPPDERNWSLHEPRQYQDCHELLDGPGVFIVKLDRDVEASLDLLQQVAWHFPQTACLAVCESDDPAVVGLAWDFGARHVLTGPGCIEQLPALAKGFLMRNT
jgi:hypothetical protein